MFDACFAYQRTQAMKAAIQLKLFTRIAEGLQSVQDIARACHASERGMRILCDFLTIHGLLLKNGAQYALTQDSALFLNEHSPAYLGRATNFLLHPMLVDCFHDLASVVRAGTTPLEGQGTVEDENPVWVEFARDMVPMMAPAAEAGAALFSGGEQPMKVLDLAAGHGIFGITVAHKNPNAEIYALDWAPVLAVAEENANKHGVAARFHKMAGSAFELPFGEGYDLALVTNFLHHFDVPTCETVMRKVHACLKPGGRAAILEFVPNEDRVSPPMAAAFALTMLVSTPSGDAYTYPELDSMCRNAGFTKTSWHVSAGLPGSWILAER